MIIAPQVWNEVIEIVERAYPDEGCGWIVGHEVREARGGRRDGFRFGDDDLIEMAKVKGEMVVFHSHPDGDADLSAADVAAMAPEGVVLLPVPQLVIAVAGGKARVAALWRLEGPEPSPEPRLIARYARSSDGWSRE